MARDSFIRSGSPHANAACSPPPRAGSQPSSRLPPLWRDSETNPFHPSLHLAIAVPPPPPPPQTRGTHPIQLPAPHRQRGFVTLCDLTNRKNPRQLHYTVHHQPSTVHASS